MRASDLLIRCFENEGVEYIFGIPGEENMDVMDSLLESNIRFVLTRHEQGAAFMADVYGRLTGRAGVCLSTLGPGATNLITGVADANIDRAPLVAVTGQVSLDRMHKESHQYMDLVAAFRPITKWNTLVHKPENIPEIVRKAFKVSQQEKPGATHIDFPEDTASSEVMEEPLSIEVSWIPEPSDDVIEKAAKLISTSENPLILAGNGVIRGEASGALLRFAEKLHIPVTNTFMGKGCIPYSNPLHLMAVGLQARDHISCGFDRADIVISIGYDLVEYHPKFWNPERKAKIIHIDSTPSEVDSYYIPSLELVGNISTSLDRISSIADRGEARSYSTRLRDYILADLEEHAESPAFPMKPQRVITEIRRVLDDGDILISDVGAHKIWIARMYRCAQPSTCIISNGFASMGIALPGAISAKLKYPQRRVIAACGDGGFMMNVQEIETAVRIGTPIVVLLFNDETYGMIRWKQMNKFGRISSVDFSNPDFVKFAESFGAKGYRVEGPDELAPILKEACESKLPSVIDCPVDYKENERLTETLGKLVCPV